MGLKPDDVFERNPAIDWKLIEDQAILVDKIEAELIRLNEVGTAIWRSLDGKKNVGTLVGGLEETFDASGEKIQNDALKFIQKLAQREFIHRIS